MENSPSNQMDDKIVITGAKVHNLKNIDIHIPRDKLTVITGLSGSGKSSLAFDTIYAEGQRRYVESLSAYARQFLEKVAKPEVESISGLSPTISIEQKTTSYNPRSTVGTVTEVYDFLRLLYARIGKPICYNCKSPIKSQTAQQMVDQILTYPEGTRISILAPIVRGRKGEHQKELMQLRQKGFVRVRIDGEIIDLSEDIKIDRNKKHDIEVYVDRVIIKGDLKTLETRISESIELALKYGDRNLVLEKGSPDSKVDLLLSEKFACTKCNISYPEPEPRTFSFNSPMGACSNCEGIGVDPDVLEEIDDPEDETERLAQDFIEKTSVCPDCNGTRLRKESLHYLVVGQNIHELCSKSISSLLPFFESIKLSEREKLIAHRIVLEITSRLQFLNRVGTGYLNLARSASTLSGGESQRIRLATQIGSSLVEVIYVLDEPSIGLHPRDHDRLLNTLTDLKNLGNTVIVVEHDRETIEKADWIIDLGPGAGRLGGEIIASGSYPQILKDKASLTGKYLREELQIELPKKRRSVDPERAIQIIDAHENNLKNIDVTFPLGVFTCVTGVSGSGKSTLVIDTLYRLLLNKLYKVEVGEIKIKSCSGLDHIDKVIDIDQKPIGKTPRSNPATYTGIFTHIRDLFSQLPDSKVRGFQKGRFSFNVKGGRCEACQGDGVKKIEMHFLPNVYVQCDTCQGKRYNRETLEIRYKGKNISEVLEMTAEEAFPFFDAIPSLNAKLKILNDVGLGYIHLGQNATTLSGGESQRIKLAKELSRKSTGKTVYILDEPSTGLHFDDIKKLVAILQVLASQGNTVIVIEHNLDIIKVADYIIDVGPEGGEAGGKIIAAGSPEQIVKVKASHTGTYLKPYLKI